MTISYRKKRLNPAPRFPGMPGRKKTKRKSKTSQRTVIEPKKPDRRYIHRNKKGEFGKQLKVARSLAADARPILSRAVEARSLRRWAQGLTVLRIESTERG